jgi:SAM-dependent methyltransferase
MKDMLTIVIPTWNNFRMLQDCVGSLFLYTMYPYKVIIVDNGGKGEVRAALPDSSASRVEVLEPGENLGWAGAHNLALENCDTPYYCMMNDDVIFSPGQTAFWRTLLGHIQGDVAAVGPCSNFVAGNQASRHLGVPIICDSSFLIGFCMVLDKDIFKEVGGLDETLPGGDDLDLSIRLRKAGYTLRIDKRAYLHHYGQQTGVRIHGSDWDSSWAQEVTNNALMAKHGVKLWQECILAQWSYPASRDADDPMVREDNWYAKNLSDFNGAAGLNIGCGGTTIEGAVGIDIRPSGSQGAGGESRKKAITDVQADALSIPFLDGSQSYIVAAHVLEHILDPLDALVEWFRLLSNEGKLFLTIPRYDKDSNSILVDYTHLHAFNEKSLANLLAAAGFIVESVEAAYGPTVRAICRKPPISVVEAAI